MQRLITILILAGCGLLVRGQTVKNFMYYDTVTYRQYTLGDWKNLKKTGKEALRKGHDYYYMRMRIGIAFYEKKQYRAAIPQFKQALRLNPNDRIALEYLYYSYMLSGRQADMQALVPRLPMSFRVKNLLDRKPGITQFGLNYQYTTNQESQIQTVYQPPQTITTEGMQFLTRNFNYFNAYLTHSIYPGGQLQHMYTFITKKDLYYFNDLNNAYLIPERQTSQHQYYINGRFRLFSGGTLSASMHYLHVKSPTYYMRQGFGSPALVAPEFISNDVVFNLAFSQEAGPFTLEASATYSYINQLDHWQQNAQLIFYPFGNLNLYSVTGASRVSELSGSSFLEERYVFREKLGLKVAGPVWLELFAYTGDLKNYADNYGASVFNSLDQIRTMAGGNLIFLLKNNTRLQISYSSSLLNSSYSPYPPVEAGGTNTYKYYVYTINGGIQWNF